MVFAILAVVLTVVILALMLDGVISRAPLERLANFPFRGLPATNGVLFGILLLLGIWLAARFSAHGGL